MGDNKLVSCEMPHVVRSRKWAGIGARRRGHAPAMPPPPPPPPPPPTCTRTAPHYTCYDFTWAACIVCIIDRIAEISSTWK